GLYYAPGTLKARLCRRGKELLYDFCARHGVPHRQTGKLVVGQKGQGAQLAAIAATAAANSVTLQPLDRAQIAALEPEIAAEAGLFSPTTGIIDSHQYMLALLAERTLACNARVTQIRRGGTGWRLTVQSPDGETRLEARQVVNAAGLWAQQVAARIEGLDGIPSLHLAKGRYALLQGPSPFRHLVYPVPEAGGLGVHATLDLAGQARFGPDVEWLENPDPGAIDYAVPATVPEQFATRIARWWPGVRAERLAPAYSGVRPKLARLGSPDTDFRIDGEEVHGLPGLVNLFGIESPGLTASLAIAEHVEALLT
ncbi:MAG TPA: NAD(P)/FAD-dependent oxidoreductase, partial [Rhizomicrobium sp.]|nr:NAD(P)/FAD-dependent oxidoreductase [Rhizomicrobium sp.]